MATKKTTSAAKKAPSSTAAPKKKAVKKTAAKSAAAPVEKAPAPAKPKAPAKKAAPAASSAKTTMVHAKVNIGWGNTLYIRGEGAGLSWDSGIPMDCKGDDAWSWSSKNVQGRIVFKFLLNDEIWSVGDDLSASAGSTTTCYPSF
jgi:hypothetical protein